MGRAMHQPVGHSSVHLEKLLCWVEPTEIVQLLWLFGNAMIRKPEIGRKAGRGFITEGHYSAPGKWGPPRRRPSRFHTIR